MFSNLYPLREESYIKLILRFYGELDGEEEETNYFPLLVLSFSFSKCY